MPIVLATLFLNSCVYGQFRPSPEGVKFERTLQMIQGLYVDDVDAQGLTEAAICGMLSELDPHSSYLNKEEVKAMNEPLQGNFDGIGISFNMLTDTLYVMEVISGGPSQKVGIMPGDKIIYVNDTIIAGVDALAREAAALQDCYDADIANSRFAWRGESKGLHEVA